MVSWKILGNLPVIQVSGLSDSMEGKKLIINLFYWLKSWNGPTTTPQQSGPDAELINKYLNEILLLKKF